MLLGTDLTFTKQNSVEIKNGLACKWDNVWFVKVQMSAIAAF